MVGGGGQDGSQEGHRTQGQGLRASLPPRGQPMPPSEPGSQAPAPATLAPAPGSGQGSPLGFGCGRVCVSEHPRPTKPEGLTQTWIRPGTTLKNFRNQQNSKKSPRAATALVGQVSTHAHRCPHRGALFGCLVCRRPARLPSARPGGLHLPRTGAGLRSPTSGQVGVPACFWLWPWLLSSPIGGFPPAPTAPLPLAGLCVHVRRGPCAVSLGRPAAP